jgi:group I intron endonuclease
MIYAIRNRINGKMYVGQTIYGLDFRWRNHLAVAKRGSGYYLHAAIRKYGRESFEPFALADGFSTYDDLLAAERLWILVLGSAAPGGYNISAGGEGRTGPNTEEHKQKIAATLKGHLVSDETRRLWSQQRKGRAAWNKGKVGIKHGRRPSQAFFDAARVALAEGKAGFKKGYTPWNKRKD